MEKELKIGTGSLTLEQVQLMLDHLPLELSFVDKNNIVTYYNETHGEKMFIRTPSSIGRDMLMSHPPKSKPMVEQLLNDLKTGAKDKQEAWYQTKEGRVIHITFVAIRDGDEYLGVLEYVQDITEITQLDGDNRNVNA